MIDYVKYHWKIFLVYMLRKVYKKEIVTKKIRRISKKYSNSDELLRWYIEKYYGVKIGKYTTFYDDILQDAASIDSIGAFCSIAKNVHFTEGNHPLQCITTSQIIYMVLCQDLKQIKMRIFHRKINICSLSCIYTII